MHQNRTAVAVQRLPVGAGPDQGGAVAQIGLRMPQCGEHQVQLLAVKTLTAQSRFGLHEQDRTLRVRAAVEGWAELIGEQPQWGVVVLCGGRHRLDGTARRKVRFALLSGRSATCYPADGGYHSWPDFRNCADCVRWDSNPSC